jgi:hypothetical protein
MKTKTIAIVLIIAASCTLLSVYLASSYVKAQGPAEINMAAVIKGLSAQGFFVVSCHLAAFIREIARSRVARAVSRVASRGSCR